MEEKAVPLTEIGKRQLEEELEYLINVRRPEIAERIHAAKQDGDIMENAGYDAAKEEQGLVEGRINYLQALLRRSVLITPQEKTDCVVLGSKVTICEVGASEREVYSIVGPAEADPAAGKISNESPLGKVLMGCRVGQTVTVKAPAGETRFKVVSIE